MLPPHFNTTVFDPGELLTAVQCIACGAYHRADSDGYLRFQGNVYVGQTGGIIGNNFAEVNLVNHPAVDGRPRIDLVVRSTIYCRRLSCLMKTFGPVVENDYTHLPRGHR